MTLDPFGSVGCRPGDVGGPAGRGGDLRGLRVERHQRGPSSMSLSKLVGAVPAGSSGRSWRLVHWPSLATFRISPIRPTIHRTRPCRSSPFEELAGTAARYLLHFAIATVSASGFVGWATCLCREIAADRAAANRTIGPYSLKFPPPEGMTSIDLSSTQLRLPRRKPLHASSEMAGRLTNTKAMAASSSSPALTAA